MCISLCILALMNFQFENLDLFHLPAHCVISMRAFWMKPLIKNQWQTCIPDLLTTSLITFTVMRKLCLTISSRVRLSGIMILGRDATKSSCKSCNSWFFQNRFLMHFLAIVIDFQKIKLIQWKFLSKLLFSGYLQYFEQIPPIFFRVKFEKCSKHSYDMKA